MNISDKVLDAQLFFPDGRKLIGRLIFTEQHYIVEFNENPNGRMSTKSIRVVFCECNSENKKYTLVHCILLNTNLDKCSYLVNEIYDGEWIKSGNEEEFIGLTASLTYLTSWLHFDLFDLTHLDNKEYYFSVKVRPNKTQKIHYCEYRQIVFDGGSGVQMEKNNITIIKKSTFEIVSKSPISRQELFQDYSSFLNLFTLFLRKLPNTFHLKYIRNDSELKLLLKNEEDISESPFDVLIRLDELEGFDKIIVNYFKSKLKFDSIIELWGVCMKKIDPEISFLHLTQSMELIHKCFFQNENSFQKLSEQTFIEFRDRCKEPPNRWIQIMRYLHLFNIIEELGIKVPFNNKKKDFILNLLDSRNFYTHHDQKEFVWSHFELYAINNILRVWMRGLLLNQLEVSIKNIQKCINSDFYSSIDIDIFRNPYSMRYRE